MPTTHYDLPLIDGGNTISIVNDLNGLANAADAAIFEVASTAGAAAAQAQINAAAANLTAGEAETKADSAIENAASADAKAVAAQARADSAYALASGASTTANNAAAAAANAQAKADSAFDDAATAQLYAEETRKLFGSGWEVATLTNPAIATGTLCVAEITERHMLKIYGTPKSTGAGGVMEYSLPAGFDAPETTFTVNHYAILLDISAAPYRIADIRAITFTTGKKLQIPGCSTTTEAYSILPVTIFNTVFDA